MQLINGRTKEQHNRKVALAMLEEIIIPVVVNTPGNCYGCGMRPITARMTRTRFRVIEKSGGWCLQSAKTIYRKKPSEKWKYCLAGTWQNVQPLFDAINRRQMIADAQMRRMKG